LAKTMDIGASPSSGANLKAVDPQRRLVRWEWKKPGLPGKLPGKCPVVVLLHHCFA